MKFSHFFCVLFVFISCKQTPTKTYLSKVTAKTIAVDSTLTSSETINEFVAPYKKKLAKEMDQVLSYAPKDFTKYDGEMQSSLGNLMADLCFDMANPKYRGISGNDIDFVMLNHGGIRATIPKGKITMGRAFKLMPFENQLVVVALTGEKLIELVQYFIRNKKAHPLSKNVALTITNNEYLLKINGKPFDKNKSYTVLTNDYLQNGGDSMIFFKNPKKLTKLDYKMRDAIIDFFKKTDTIKATTDNRVILK